MTPITLAVCLLILGNLAASLSDVAVKQLGEAVSPFQYMFIRQLIALLILLPLWLRLPSEQRRLTNVKMTCIRAHLIIIGAGCMVIALTHLPLATANAIFYAAPLLMLPLAAWWLKESVRPGKAFLTAVGFAGVLIVLRPSEFHWASLFAMITAVTLALFNLSARTLPQNQPVLTTLMWTTFYSLPSSGVLAMLFWQPLKTDDIILIATSATLILLYNRLAVMAYRRNRASEIALAEYSGLLFVVLLGVILFDEIPDTLSAIGIALIILPLIPPVILRQVARKIRCYLLRPKPPSESRKNITD